jgi:hypothetical protein
VTVARGHASPAPSSAMGHVTELSERTLQAGDPKLYSAKVHQRAHATASNDDRQHIDLAGKAAGRPALHVVRDEEARAPCVPDRAANHEQSESLADMSQRGSPAPMQVTASVVSALLARGASRRAGSDHVSKSHRVWLNGSFPKPSACTGISW